MDIDIGATNDNHQSQNHETVCLHEKDRLEPTTDFLMDFTDETPVDFLNLLDSDYLGQRDANDDPWGRSPVCRDPSNHSSNSAPFSPHVGTQGRSNGNPITITPSQQSPQQNVCHPQERHSHHFQNCSQSHQNSRPMDIYSRKSSNRGEDHYGGCATSVDRGYFDRGMPPFHATAQNNQQFHLGNIPLNPRGAITPLSMQSRASSICSSMPSERPWCSTSKCLATISKLQKLLRDSSYAPLDIILATNKSAISELDANLSGIPMTPRSLDPEDQFSSYFPAKSNTSGPNFSTSNDPVPLMLYVVALKHIYELYSQACFMFTPETNRDQFSSMSTPNSFSHDTPSFDLPKLDFGSFKIDVADQRRLFSEIIARELENCLTLCQRVRTCFTLQPGDTSGQTGLLEETFSGIEKGTLQMIEQLKV